MADSTTQVDEIIRRLTKVRTSTITVGILSAILLSLMIAAGSWLVISLLDMVVGLSGGVLRVIAVFLLVAALGVLAYEVVKVFSVSHSIRAYAARVAGELREVGLDLLTALDLSRIDNTKLGYSDVLITKVIDGIAEKLKGFDLQVSVRRRSIGFYSVALICLVAAGALWFMYDAPRASYSVARLGFFLGFSRDSQIAISVEPGDEEILVGEDLTIRVEVTGYARRTPALHVISDGGETAFTMERLDSLEAEGTSRFNTMLARLDRDIGYFVTLGDQRTRVYHVWVREEPRIKSGTLMLTYPAHTGRGTETLARGIWDINAPYGTNLRMSLMANCAAESVWLSASDSAGATRVLPLTVSGDSLLLRQVLQRDFDYSIELIAASGARAKPHGPHAVRVTRDEPPYVRIESPGQEILLEADMIIPLSVVALDDYGISVMKLAYDCPAETAVVNLTYHGLTQARCEHTWDVGSLDLFPGDVITYYVSVADNDALTGPKFARTDAYIARIPTFYEVYQEIEDQQHEDIDSLDEIAQEARDLKEHFDDLIEDMKRDNEIHWEEEQAIKQSLSRQDELRQKIEDVAASLDETLDMMGQSDLIDFEVIEKMEEIRRLLSEVATDEMRQAMEKMREAMEKLSPEEIRSAMENLDITQEDLLRRLDKAIEMLKRLQVQQRMESVLNLANDLAERQKQVNEEVKEGGDLDKAAGAERGLLSDAGVLEKMMEDLAGLLRDQKSPLSSEIEKAGEFFQSSGIKQAMSEAASSMSSGDRADALEQGGSAAGNLSQLANMLQKARDTLMGEERRQLMEALTKAMHGLRDVSAKQEAVLAELEGAGEGATASELARMEMVYKEALDRIAEDLFEISMKSMFISPMAGMTVLGIGAKLESAAGLLSQGKRAGAIGDAKSSLGAMNSMITGLMDTMEQASSCSSPSGLADAFQCLDNMCAQQMGINQGTQQLLSEEGIALSMEARAQMARLAAEQETVKEGIEDLARGLGGRSEILGRLDDLIGEAQRAVEDLRQQNVSEETLRRQERILTRLLNAQKSMRRRDYSQRRKSEPGEDYDVASPPELSVEEQEQLLHDLLYGRRGYYPPEYEDLIRAYFNAISAGKAGR